MNLPLSTLYKNKGKQMINEVGYTSTCLLPRQKLSAYSSPIFGCIYFDLLLMTSEISLCILNRSVFQIQHTCTHTHTHTHTHTRFLTSPGFAY